MEPFIYFFLIYFFNDETLRISRQLQWRRFVFVLWYLHLLPKAVAGRKGSRDHRSPERAVVPVAAGRPAQTLPSEQTRLPWWTEAALFTPRVKVLWGWLTVRNGNNFGDEIWLRGIQKDEMKKENPITVLRTSGTQRLTAPYIFRKHHFFWKYLMSAENRVGFNGWFRSWTTKALSCLTFSISKQTILKFLLWRASTYCICSRSILGYQSPHTQRRFKGVPRKHKSIYTITGFLLNSKKKKLHIAFG